MWLFVVVLGDGGAFELCSSLTQVIFTPGLTILVNYMFNMGGGSGATLLGSVTVPSTIKIIGDKFFYCCYFVILLCFFVVKCYYYCPITITSLYNNKISEALLFFVVLLVVLFSILFVV